MTARYFVIEYLSTGVYEVEGEPEGDYLKTTRCSRGLHRQGFRKPNWYATLDEAVTHANILRANRLKQALREVERLATNTAVKVKLLPAKRSRNAT